VDWSFFFLSWGIRKRYPQVLDDPEHGAKARELLAAAREMLGRLAADPKVKPAAVYAILPAAADGNDLSVKNRRLHFLRKQGVQESRCISDYVDAGDDHIGLFVTTAGQGMAEITAGFRTEGDDYNAMLTLILANRLAEALAEYVHHRIRVKWGCESVQTPREMLEMKYSGVRPAVGYPSWPDHSELATVFELLDAERRIGVSYTESFMMLPESSCCGMVLAHPEAEYFDVGRIAADQLEDYARRKGITPEEAGAMLVKNV
jgi:5-methyltetrahydrofolate--homocysteine methyltransferase